MKAWAALTLVRADPDCRHLSRFAFLLDSWPTAGVVPEIFCTGRKFVEHVVRAVAVRKPDES